MRIQTLKSSRRALLGGIAASGILFAGMSTVFADTTTSTGLQQTTVTLANPNGPMVIALPNANAIAASILGISEDSLMKDLQGGQSIATIAEAQGLSEQTLITDIESALKKQMDSEVSDSKLTATQEQDALNTFAANAKRFVEQVPTIISSTKLVNQNANGATLVTAPETLPTSSVSVVPQATIQTAAGTTVAIALPDMAIAASILGITETSLMKDLQAGQSIAAVAQAKGISEQTLISDMESAMKKLLDSDVASGKLTSAQEQDILNQFGANAKSLVEEVPQFISSTNLNLQDQNGTTTASATS